MAQQTLTPVFENPTDVLAFSPPSSRKEYKHIVDGKLNILPLASVSGVVGHRFDFQEPGGTGALLPGRPLFQSMPVNIPANAGWFAMVSGVNHAFVHPNGTLAERPFGQAYAVVGIDGNARTLNCLVRLTDSNSDDPIHIIVDAIAVFFN